MTRIAVLILPAKSTAIDEKNRRYTQYPPRLTEITDTHGRSVSDAIDLLPMGLLRFIRDRRCYRTPGGPAAGYRIRSTVPSDIPPLNISCKSVGRFIYFNLRLLFCFLAAPALTIPVSGARLTAIGYPIFIIGTGTVYASTYRTELLCFLFHFTILLAQMYLYDSVGN